MIQLISAVDSAFMMPRKLETERLSGATDLMSSTSSPSGSTSEEFYFRMDDDDDNDENAVAPLETDDVENEAVLSTKEDVASVLAEPEEMKDGYPRFVHQYIEAAVGKGTCSLDVQPQVALDEISHPPSNIEPSRLKSDQRTSAPRHLHSSCLVRSPEASRNSRLLRMQQTLGITSTESDAPVSLGVQFSTVTIRDFPRTIGDNPASSAGLSVSIDWKYEAEHTLPLDEYEERRKPRRNGREMIMPPQLREAILREAGFSRAEFVRALRELNVIRGQRRRTYETLHLQPFQALTEKLSRKFLNLVTMGEFKRKERNLINKYRSTVQADKHSLVNDLSNQETFPIATQNAKVSSDLA